MPLLRGNRAAAARTFGALDAENPRSLWFWWKIKASQLPMSLPAPSVLINLSSRLWGYCFLAAVL